MMIDWKIITSEQDLEQLKLRSFTTPQVIFKHSTRCGTSFLVKESLEQDTIPQDIDFNFLDLIANRALSNKVAKDYVVTHQSPQVLVIINGAVTYHKSHSAIRMAAIAEHV